MPRIVFDRNNQPANGDWIGNNAAFTCPLCGHVFIVTTMSNIHGQGGQRDCPNCLQSRAHVGGGRLDPQAEAFIEWPDQ